MLLPYIFQRILLLVLLIFILSICSFVIIELPAGDFLTAYISRLKMEGYDVSQEEAANLNRIYGLDKPIYQRYLKWIGNIVLHGDLGRSLRHNKTVQALIGERLIYTVAISFCTIIITWLIAVPIGIFSATHQYSLFDYIWTVIGFIGLGTPNFVLALLVMWVAFVVFGFGAVGLQSPEFLNSPWSIYRILDLIKHLWVPVIIVAVTGTAGLIRITRGTLLDELKKPYVMTARAKGVKEGKLLLRYPVRIAFNPLISTIGWMLPAIFSGEALVAIVLNLPTIGPLLLDALLNQDMYLAGSIVLILGFLTITGTIISDILLVWVDPRIRYGRVEG